MNNVSSKPDLFIPWPGYSWSSDSTISFHPFGLILYQFIIILSTNDSLFEVIHLPIVSCAFSLWSSSMNDCTRAMASWSSTMPHWTLALKGFISSLPEWHASAACCRWRINFLSRKRLLFYVLWPFRMIFASIKTIDCKRVLLLPQLTSSQHHQNKLPCNSPQNRRQHLPAVQPVQLCQ